MASRDRANTGCGQTRRSSRSVMLALAALMTAAGLLGGCVVETPGHPYHGWWWHHHD